VSIIIMGFKQGPAPKLWFMGNTTMVIMGFIVIVRNITMVYWELWDYSGIY